MAEFVAAAIDESFQNCVNRFQALVKANPVQLSDIGGRCKGELRTFRERGFLTIAFVGEYSAGKSTIISALTHRRDIKISADITTQTTTQYDWNGIKLIDTPGLFTERKDHDEITYNTIRQADLLAFCLTHSLFDDVTSENFKKLAYEQRFHAKMMLVVNKFSSEAGHDDVKIKNYKKSIADALEGHELQEFPLCFIDARDYIEGIDESSDELKTCSRFDTFIDTLNKFVERKGTLARLDTPIRIAVNHLVEACSALARATEKDNAYLELLSRISRAVLHGRTRLRERVRGISSSLAAQVVRIGTNLSHVTEDIEAKVKEAEAEIRKLSEEAGGHLDKEVQEAQESLKKDVDEILNSRLMNQLCASIVAGEISSKGVDIRAGNVSAQVKTLTEIGNKLGVSISSLAHKSGLPGGLMTASGASGSYLHKGILSAGHYLGHSFKPWQAANLAKTIGNVATAATAVLAIISIVVDVRNAMKEAEREKELSESRREIVANFVQIAADLGKQFDKQLHNIEKELHDKVDEDIGEARKKKETEIADSNDKVAAAIKIRQDLDALLERVIVRSSVEP